MDRKELEAQAKELDLKVDGRWSDERLSEEINALLDDKADAEFDVDFVSTVKGKYEWFGSIYLKGDVVSLSSEQLENPSVKHAINLGLLKAC